MVERKVVMNDIGNMAPWYEREIPEGYEARIEGNKVIFELKESEDERIRNDIMEAVENWLPYERVEDIRAYLKKQKEQKHSLTFDAISSWLRDHANNYVNGEFNEFHHCVDYDGTINVEKLIADLKVAVDGGTFDVDAKFNAREPRDNWEYIKEFCNKFGRIPKDMDELDTLVSYVMNKKQKEQKDYRKLYEDIAQSEWFKNAYVGKSLGGEFEQKEQNVVPSRETILGIWELGNFWKENPEERNGLTQLQYIQKYWLEKCDYQKEQKPTENISQLIVQGKGVYKICPRCKERMVRDDSKVYTSMPPQYGYKCPKCGEMEFDTVMYDSPEMEERRKPLEWSEEDSRKIGTLSSIIFDYAFHKDALDENNDLTGEYAELDNWLECLPERFNLQPKQEWSEADKKLLRSTLECLNYVSCQSKTSVVNWLRTLPERFNLQPKQERDEGEKPVIHENDFDSEAGTADDLDFWP